MDDCQKDYEELKTEIAGIKVRLRRIESFLQTFPSPEDFIRDREEENDELFEDAKKLIVQYDRASASLLQRRLGIGYARAVKLMDELESAKVVASGEDPKPRKVLIKKSDLE